MTKKTDNHNLRAKLDLRRAMLRKLKPGFSVLDCFAGEQKIWTRLRQEFECGEYLSIDEKPGRGRLKMDSLRFLQNQKWSADVVDLDCYGCPWDHDDWKSSAETATAFDAAVYRNQLCRADLKASLRT